MPAALRERVFAIVAARLLCDPAALRVEMTLVELGMDSLGLVETIFAIEEEFGISVPFNANAPGAPDFDTSTLGSIAAEVERLVATERGARA